MCFSAEASFAASGVLAASGIAISRIPKEKSEIPLSVCPIIFAAHQFIEGILWLHHSGTLSDEYRSGAVYGFVLIALVLWPIYVPFAAYKAETGKIRRRIIFACQLIGLYVGITFLINIFNHSVDVSVVGHSFSYDVETPDNFLLPYVISVSIPFLVSSKKGLRRFGIALTLSCAVAIYVASSSTFPSVWCFYAALLSIGLYGYFRSSSKAYTAKH